ncbi:unnamed protein product [Allacma fusca]|uniref:Uncharacterized protein n=1 Tax=Allacma fusca TaxID=39272 RepID=A0A8J2KY18_9HEXA|nr:unnamed protein product [Allacma fusca]
MEILSRRLDLSMRIDEKPQFIINDHHLLQLMSARPADLDSIIATINTYLESMPLWIRSFKKILDQGSPCIELMRQSKCHNCFQNGHCAWGCLEDYSAANQKRFYEENPMSKNQVNRRRRQQKVANRKIRIQGQPQQ